MEEFDNPLNDELGVDDALLVEETFEVMVIPFNTEESPVTANDLIGQYAILWIPIFALLLMHVIMRIPMMKETWKI